MKHIAGWFRRNNTIMAQAKDLQRQWQEMRDEYGSLDNAYDIVCEQVRREEENHNYTREQLHRVARERDNERELRLEAYGVCQDAMNQIGAERSLRLEAEGWCKDWEGLVDTWIGISERWESAFNQADNLRLDLEEQLAEVRNRLIEAEVALLDYHLDKREKDEEGRAADRGWLDTTDNEEE